MLVTGGTGYVGSHVAVELAACGHRVTMLDNLSHSSRAAADRVQHVVDRRCEFVEADVRDRGALDAIFAGGDIDAVVHCAALKSVADSIDDPRAYYENNIGGTLVLLGAMADAGCSTLVFSSSATVYDPSGPLPFTEESRTGPINPYGRTKLIIEEVLDDVAAADPDAHFISLRYFNPVGAHPSALIGEDPDTDPTNLMPRVLDVALGVTPELAINGSDYDTPDGTAVRDYIHVVDVARAHSAALDRVRELPGHTRVNIGTGAGASVLEVVDAVRAASGRPIATRAAPRRPGDAPQSLADPSLARALLGWRAEHGLAEMAVDAWRWRSRNPDGYR